MKPCKLGRELGQRYLPACPDCVLSAKLDRLLDAALVAQTKRYRILTDDDGHDYVIQVGKEDAFQAWVDNGPYWEDYQGEDFNESRLGCHLSCYSFTDFQEDR